MNTNLKKSLLLSFFVLAGSGSFLFGRRDYREYCLYPLALCYYGGLTAVDLADEAKEKIRAGYQNAKDYAFWADYFSGTMALDDAISNGKIDKVRALIKKGVNVNRIDRKGNTPLYYAVKDFEKDIIKLLLENKADNNKASAGTDTDNPFSQTPLVQAICTNTAAWPFDVVELIEFLIKYGADVNQKSANLTPLEIALIVNPSLYPYSSWGFSKTQAEIAALLIKSGAELPTETQIRKWPMNAAQHYLIVLKIILKDENIGDKTPQNISQAFEFVKNLIKSKKPVKKKRVKKKIY